MNTDRLVQRYVDGELSAGQNAAVAELVRSRPETAKTLAQLEYVHEQLTAHAGERFVSDTHEVMSALLARLPTTPPVRQGQLRLLDVSLAAVMITVIVLRCFGLAGSFRDLVPLTILAFASMLAGGLLILMAGPLRATHSGMMKRLLYRRVNVGTGGVAVYRVVGIAIFIGGIWLTH
jgi:anti-sigma factor RsiW